MTEFFQSIIQLYSNMSVFSLLFGFVFMNVQTIFLIWSVRDHMKMIQGRFSEESLRKYRNARIYYIVAFVLMHNMSAALALPLMGVLPDVKIPLMICIFFIAIFWTSMLCLLRLEAGFAIVFLLMADIGSFNVWYQMLTSRGVSSHDFSNYMFMLALFKAFVVLFYWLFRGNPLAQKYLGVRSANDFYLDVMEQENTEPTKNVLPR